MIENIIYLILFAMLFATAIAIVKIDSLFPVVILAGVFSLLSALLFVTLDAVDGTSLTIFAGAGVLDGPNQQARLDGLARLETSSGYMMETAGLLADLETGQVTSLGRLEVQAPFGSLTAGQVDILVTSEGEGQQMRFTDGVKLVYDPANAERAAE